MLRSVFPEPVAPTTTISRGLVLIVVTVVAVELLEAKEAEPGRSYPRVVFEHAPAPDQYDPEENEDEGSIFDEMMGDFNEFDGDDSYDDEY